jgi:hypothetical protein
MARILLNDRLFKVGHASELDNVLLIELLQLVLQLLVLVHECQPNFVEALQSLLISLRLNFFLSIFASKLASLMFSILYVTFKYRRKIKGKIFETLQQKWFSF